MTMALLTCGAKWIANNYEKGRLYGDLRGILCERNLVEGIAFSKAENWFLLDIPLMMNIYLYYDDFKSD